MGTKSSGRSIDRRLRRCAQLVCVLAAIGGVVGPLSASASAHIGRCHAYYYGIGGSRNATLAGNWTDTSPGGGGTAQASESVTDSVKRPVINSLSYAIFMSKCKPEWRVRLGDQHGAFAMSGSWSIPNGDGTTDSGTCSAHYADAVLGVDASSNHSTANVGISGQESANSNNIAQCNGNDTVGANSGLSLSDMNSPFQTRTTLSKKLPNGPVRSFSLNLHSAQTSSGSSGASYSLTWDMKLQFKRIGGLCTYVLNDYCGIPPH